MQGQDVHLLGASASAFSTSTPRKASTSSSDDQVYPMPPSNRKPLGDLISPYASHFVMLDDGSGTSGEVLGADQQKSSFRHFHYEMIKAMETCEYPTCPFFCK